MSRVLVALLLAVYTLLVGCASSSPPPSIHSGATFAFLRHVANAFATETAVCVYGIVRPDTIIVEYLRPAKIDSASANSVRYDECSRPVPALHGRLRYLGVYHNHPPKSVVQCAQSHTDRWSFNGDTAAILDFIGCMDSVVVVRK